ncbi:ATPase [Actinoplanes sp. SE50]|uniref:AAA family ATPase n=1 Tax=unclassified Actinoplanes TaxID=2626549 RepID=UPI00023ED3D6|nr:MULTISPECIES: MoxR family ATPase [unclassified Actinoplanes]AEV82809.1 MoxR-like ATPase [Actinoplanes sp. SE50/110]ATO81205.1 ATPase [Actinoplanes sp. SE50]SLL98612.1 ATPase [Actinoplanes sp. SE50/110]
MAQPSTPETETTPEGAAPVPPAHDASQLERAMFEVKRVIVGQDRMVERMFVALLARGHCLLEGVPGVAKTLAVETLAKVVGGTFSRVQFTPDLVPADIVGTRIYRQSNEKFDVELGPVFVNFLLADEINRAPAKVQSALLEVMAEHQVSIGGKSHEVPDPFLVMATQNPIEQEGVYPLPEAQRDRFLMKIIVGYPTDAEEREIVYRMGVSAPEPKQVFTPDDLLALQRRADQVFVHNALVDYTVRLVLATRAPAQHGMPDVAQLIQYGASPRASLGIVRATRALALLRGRDYALPQDLQDVAPDILRHRLVLSYDALADDVPADQIVARIMQAVPMPSVASRQGAAPAGGTPPLPPGPPQPVGAPAFPQSGAPAFPQSGAPAFPQSGGWPHP